MAREQLRDLQFQCLQMNGKRHTQSFNLTNPQLTCNKLGISSNQLLYTSLVNATLADTQVTPSPPFFFPYLFYHLMSMAEGVWSAEQPICSTGNMGPKTHKIGDLPPNTHPLNTENKLHTRSWACPINTRGIPSTSLTLCFGMLFKTNLYQTSMSTWHTRWVINVWMIWLKATMSSSQHIGARNTIFSWQTMLTFLTLAVNLLCYSTLGSLPG